MYESMYVVQVSTYLYILFKNTKKTQKKKQKKVTKILSKMCPGEFGEMSGKKKKENLQRTLPSF